MTLVTAFCHQTKTKLLRPDNSASFPRLGLCTSWSAAHVQVHHGPLRRTAVQVASSEMGTKG